MKPWQWAVGTSVGLHLAALAVLSPSPPAGERVGVRGVEPVAFTVTRVTLAGRAAPAPGPVAAPPPRALRPPLPAGERVGERAVAADVAADVAASVAAAVAANVAADVSPGVSSGVPDGAPDGVADGPVVANGASALSPTLSPAGEREGAEGGERIDLTALVHARLAAMADRCYPATARRFQQRGTVQLSFCTTASGGAADVAVTGSSGAELLDAAARGCVVERAAPFPPEAASRCFSVPVRFGARPAQ